MKARIDEMTKVMDEDVFSSRQESWGGMTVAYEQCSGPADPAPLFAALPTGRCECPHWGYVLRGSITYRYADHDEVAREGDVYYAAPGHIPLLTEAAAVIEISPTAEYEATVKAVEAALASARAGA